MKATSVTESILGTPHGNSTESARFPLYHQPPDAAGAGAGGTAQGGTGAGSGQSQGTGQQGQGQGTGQTQFTKFDPNGMYDFGDGKPVKGADYLGTFVPKADHDKLSANYSKGRDFLISEAAKLEQQWKQLQAKMQGQQPQQGTRPNPMDKFKEMPVIDGAALTEAYAAMREGDIAPILQIVKQQQTAIARMEAQMKQVSGGFGSINEQQQTAQHAQRVEQAITGLGQGFDPKNEILRDIADDVYLSHDPKDPNLAKEFPMMLKKRVDGLRAMFRAMDKAAVEAAKGQKRTFTRPGGNASPGQPSRYVHENGSTLARRVFGEVQGQQT